MAIDLEREMLALRVENYAHQIILELFVGTMAAEDAKRWALVLQHLHPFALRDAEALEMLSIDEVQRASAKEMLLQRLADRFQAAIEAAKRTPPIFML